MRAHACSILAKHRPWAPGLHERLTRLAQEDREEPVRTAAQWALTLLDGR